MYPPYCRAEPRTAGEADYGLSRPSSSATTSTAETPTISNQRRSSHSNNERGKFSHIYLASDEDSTLTEVELADSPKATTRIAKRAVPQSIPASELYSHLEGGTADTIASNTASIKSNKKPPAKQEPPVMLTDSSRTRNIVRVPPTSRPSHGLFSHPPMKDSYSSDTESSHTIDEECPIDPVAMTRTVSVQSATGEERQGQACFGCIDFRRAVAISGAILIILEIVRIILVTTGIYGKYVYGLKDETYIGKGVGGAPIFRVKEAPDMLHEYKTIELVIAGVSILLSILAMAGAKLYNAIMVGINAVWLLVSYILGIILVLMHCDEYCGSIYQDSATHQLPYHCSCGLNIPATLVAGVLAGLFIYPHVGLVVQIQKGIMSSETYPREKYSHFCKV